jgi:hypothetical protein
MANKIPCPQCKQKFKTETGLEWHLNHIHDQPEHSSNLNSRTGTKSVANSKVTAKSEDPATKDDLLALKRELNEVKEGLTSRLDVNLKRASWLSERISTLEENSPNTHKTESR